MGRWNASARGTMTVAASTPQIVNEAAPTPQNINSVAAPTPPIISKAEPIPQIVNETAPISRIVDEMAPTPQNVYKVAPNLQPQQTNISNAGAREVLRRIKTTSIPSGMRPTTYPNSSRTMVMAEQSWPRRSLRESSRYKTTMGGAIFLESFCHRMMKLAQFILKRINHEAFIVLSGFVRGYRIDDRFAVGGCEFHRSDCFIYEQ